MSLCVHCPCAIITSNKRIRMKAFLCFALFAVASAIPLQNAQVVIIPDGPIPIPVEMLRSGSFMPVWRDFPQVPQVPDLPIPERNLRDLPIPERNLRDLPNFQISEVRFLDAPEIQEVYANAPSEIAPEAVKIVDLSELSSANAEEILPQDEDIVPEPVNVVEYFEPSNVAAEEIVPLAEVAPHEEEIVPEPVNVVEYFEPANVANEVVPSAEEVVPQAEEIVPEPVNVVEYFEPVGADVLSPELPALEDAEMRFVKFVDTPATFDLKNVKVPIDAHDIV